MKVEKRVEANGLSFRVIDEGEGPAVVLLHGFPDSADLWAHQISGLGGAGFRVVAPDLRGFGDSDRPEGTEAYGLLEIVADVKGITESLGIERFGLVGHDWGAVVAWLLATLEADRVEALVALSVGHPSTFRKAGIRQMMRSWYIFLFQFEGVAEEALRKDDWRLLRDWVSLLGGKEAEHYVEDLSRPGALTAGLNWYRANIPPESFTSDAIALPQVGCPVIGIWSSGDGALTEEQMTLSEQFVAGPWRYVRFDDCGHWIPRESPGRLNALLLEFLGKHIGHS